MIEPSRRIPLPPIVAALALLAAGGAPAQGPGASLPKARPAAPADRHAAA